jgi:DNA-binding transcriptional MerR regulator
MLTISKVAELTGISAHTLRYYEKIGLLPSPARSGGIRQYTEADIQFLRFLHSLKKTGMSLEEIAEFVMDGCIMQDIEQGDKNIQPKLIKRTRILSKHLENMLLQRQRLDEIIKLTEEKLDTYHRLLHREQARGKDEI